MHESKKHVVLPGLATVISAVLTLSACGEKPKAVQGTRATVSKTVSKAVEGPRAKVAKTVPEPQAPAPNSSPEVDSPASGLPQVMPLNEPFDHPKPSEITASDKAYRIAAERLAKRVLDLIVELQNELSKINGKDNSSARGNLFWIFLKKVLEAGMQDPVLAEYCKKVSSSNRPDEVASHLKPILLRGGLYWMVGYVNEVPKMRIYNVDEMKMFKVEDGQYSADIPLAVLGENLFGLDAYKDWGFQDSQFNMAFLIKENIQPDKMIASLKAIGIKDLPSEISEVTSRACLDDAIRHELTHEFISRKFDHLPLGNPHEPLTQGDLKISLGATASNITHSPIASLEGPFSYVQLQEACAVGNEIAQSQSDLPLFMSRYYAIDPSRIGYEMVSLIIAPLTFKIVPEGDMKDALIAQYKAGSLTRQAFLPVTFPLLKDKTNRQVLGGTMYRICTDILSSANALLPNLD